MLRPIHTKWILNGVSSWNTRRARCHQFLLLVSKVKVKSNMPISVWLIGPSKIHYHIKLNRNLASSFSNHRQFSYPKVRRSKVKVKCHQYAITCMIRHSTHLWPSHINFWSVVFQLLCGHAHGHTKTILGFAASLGNWTTCAQKQPPRKHEPLATPPSSRINFPNRNLIDCLSHSLLLQNCREHFSKTFSVICRERDTQTE